MKRKSNMFILLLVTILFVSCKFFGNKSASKEKKDTPFSHAAKKISKSGTVVSSNKQEENKSNFIGETKKHTSSPDMLTDALAVSDTTNRDKQENKDKLTEEDKKKLNAFFSTTTTYQSSLDSIYNKYTSSYNTIDTYGSCNEYRIGCFSTKPSEERRKALVKLKENNLDQEYVNLNKMLKNAVSSYNKRDLEDAITQYKKAIKQAIEAECKIETVSDYKAAQEAPDEKKEKNLANLKIIKSVLPIIKKTIEEASLAYADAFAFVTASLSCGKGSEEFKEAVKGFNDAAKQYTNGNKGDNAVSVIVGAISGMAYSGFEDSWFNNAKMFALNKEGGEVKKMIAAIDKLCAVYKKVNP
ncbi:hypothetical protein [Borreliella garinii]|uniref:hypothetical protein n=1 Tax=Borreliella garinii TaxID=29519 RepID=UPI001AEF5527|nr:hypothetical protein [Borreliella garinii]